MKERRYNRSQGQERFFPNASSLERRGREEIKREYKHVPTDSPKWKAFSDEVERLRAECLSEKAIDPKLQRKSEQRLTFYEETIQRESASEAYASAHRRAVQLIDMYKGDFLEKHVDDGYQQPDFENSFTQTLQSIKNTTKGGDNSQ